MRTSHCATLVLAALTALAGCTSTVPKDPKVNGGEIATGDDAKPEALVDVAVAVAVGSVLLESDCPDPSVIDPAVPASTVAPPAPSMRPARRALPPSAPAKPAEGPMPGVAVNRRPCQQSTLQLTFDNRGSAPAKVSIVEVTLRDVETDQVVATLPSRKPSKWSDDDNAYASWDQSLAASSSARTSYRIKPPSWSAVEAKLEGKASRGRTYDVEVSLQIDGEAATARSAEFTRPPVMPMPPT